MNTHCFRVIVSRLLNRPVVVSELQNRQGQAASGVRQGRVQLQWPSLQPSRLAASIGLTLGLMTSVEAAPLPTGGAVAAGSASITTAGTAMTIQQNQGNAVINWNSFDIANGNSVTFQHANVTDATLNRVSGARSQIDGLLNANGRVFLLNPNGVLFGSTAQVNVGGLVVSTQAIGDSDFMNGNYVFSPAVGVTTPGAIINNGTLLANGEGGFVVLSGAGTVTNTGTLSATGGTVQMAQGKEFKLTMPSGANPFLNLELTASASPDADLGVNNTGTIKARNVELKAIEGWVKHSGGIEATSLAQLAGGKNGSVLLSADQGGVQIYGTSKKAAKIKADGNIVVNGHSTDPEYSVAGADITYAALDAKNNIHITGTSIDHLGVLTHDTLATGNNIVIKGASKNYAGVYVSATSAYEAKNDINVTGKSEQKEGVYVLSKLTAHNNINIDGESQAANGSIVASTINAKNDINVTGKSNAGHGADVIGKLTANNINIAGESQTGEGSSLLGFGTTLDAKNSINIQGKSNSGGGVIVHGTLHANNINIIGESQIQSGVILTGSGTTVEASNNIYIKGTSNSGDGVRVAGKLNASNNINIVGVSKTGTGSYLTAPSTVNAKNDITVAGKSETGSDVKVLGALTANNQVTINP